MPIFSLSHELLFPPITMSEPDGLLAIGGDLSPQRLLLAYQSGIFPWYEGEHILWWSPDPRFVLFPSEVIISKSMKTLIARNTFKFTINHAFSDVITACKKINRKDQDGTWITDEVRLAYINLHQKGYAHSAEAWENGILVGGLYGIRIGNVFFGESMFTTKSNASKFAFINYVAQLRKENVAIIDCQVYTSHLESLGARMIPREDFMNIVNQNLVPR